MSSDIALIDGVQAAAVARPGSQDAVAEVLRTAARDKLTVVPCGAGTKLDWGCPPRSADILLDVSALDAVVEHVAGDLVVRVQPGVRLSSLAVELARANQRLAIDGVVPGSTVGGIVSTALSGPSRLLYGTVRDLLIGITVVRADGAVTHSGGKVVKNVAGYDLGKLYTGAYGSLGVITEAIFRLHPVPEAAAWVVADLPDERAVGTAVAAVLDSQVMASALEICRPAPAGPITVAVLLEGVAPGVKARSAAVSALLGSGAATGDEAPSWWSVLPGPIILKLTAEIALVPPLLRGLREAAAVTRLAVDVRGSAGVGVLFAGLAADADPEATGRFVLAARAHCRDAGGFAVLLRAPAAVRARVDAWGPVAGLSLMRRLKDEFDPDHRMAPGRFVGGL
ncbi:MAG: FAD-binding oxidoreductase [Pseudonocardiales bacterium]|nr:MAG: FAD-binding oxidoreductase [Pseudonocardiales bacterium]